MEDMDIIAIVCARNGHLIPFKVKELFWDSISELYGDESSPIAQSKWGRLASRKGVSGDGWSEVSETAKAGMHEQELHKRHHDVVKVAHERV